MKIHMLNHASFIIESDSIKLLFDPWLMGTCFNEGWQLKWSNDHAFNKIKNCTHLWISHFHEDHMHKPSLMKILEINPNIICIGNHSLNFQLDQAFKSFGFKNIIAFNEREVLKLSDDFSIKRYPTTGIDNMLVIRAENKTLLNFNDCVIPSYTQKKLRKKIGHIDYLFTNFNHAGKLLHFPEKRPSEVKELLKQSFLKGIKSFTPQKIIPFASHHLYMDPLSHNQNDSLLELSELTQISQEVIALEVGGVLETSTNTVESTQCSLAPIKKSNAISVSANEIEENFKTLINKIRTGFPFSRYFLKDLVIKIQDNELCYLISFKKKQIMKTDKPAHILSTSYQVNNWFKQLYGTDSFLVGAHLRFLKEYPSFKLLIILLMLQENKLDLISLMNYVFTFKGLKFLYHRREEILGILLERKIGSDYQNS